MSPVGPAHLLGLSVLMFATGLAGVLIRRNLIVVLMSVELMLNAVNLSFVAFARQWGDVAGHVFPIFIITVAAGEAAIGLALVISFYRLKGSLQVDEAQEMRG